jgi:hypothetical protein
MSGSCGRPRQCAIRWADDTRADEALLHGLRRGLSARSNPPEVMVDKWGKIEKYQALLVAAPESARGPRTHTRFARIDA